ncbi:MAG: nitroreductase family protein [Desulfobacteraceae bacterium]|nr:nitroreductase family protein [Desulfobacteraceae bacterium]
MESFKDLVKMNRSCRRFDNNHKIEPHILEELVDLTRYCASASNKQPLKYILSTSEQKNEEIFSCLGWAGYLKDWKGPKKKEQPVAYIVITGDQNLANNFWCDHGIAAQTILLGARDQGLAGCIFGAINIKKLTGFLNIEDHLEIKLVIALGKPIETIVIDEVGENEDIKYFRDENQVHHVPKRKLADLIIGTW